MGESRHERLFVSIALPETVKDSLGALQNEMRRLLAGDTVRWTRREQFHLTLRFLGDVELARTEALQRALAGAGQACPPLRLRALGVGCFPDLRRPKVLWVGVTDGAGELARLQAAVKLASNAFTSEAPEARFTGHVTLARLRLLPRAEVDKLRQSVAGMRQQCLGEWTTGTMELMRSELVPQGARHSVVASIALQG